jgi:flagellar motor switch protein FliN
MIPAEDSSPNLKLLLDVPVSVTVELGACKLSMREVLQLNTGSVVQLEKMAEEPVDLLVNGKLLACGEVIVVDNKFGIKITHLIASPEVA